MFHKRVKNFIEKINLHFLSMHSNICMVEKYKEAKSMNQQNEKKLVEWLKEKRSLALQETKGDFVDDDLTYMAIVMTIDEVLHKIKKLEERE